MSEMPREGETTLADGHAPGSSRPPGDDEAGADRNLLLGLLAFQNGFIEHHTLVDAVHAWIADKSKPLGETLRGWGVLDQSQLEILTLLVDQHLKTHGSASRSLGKIESTISFLDEFASIEDEGVRRRLAEAQSYRAREGERRGEASDCRYRKPVQDARFSGGLGDVFIAEDQELGRRVALKEIRPRDAFDSQTRARFLLEGEVTGNLEHPGIVPVYGLGRYADGRPYYAMRLIKGENLKETIDGFRREHSARKDPEAKALGLRKLLLRFIDVCNAIEYAHSRGVLHRDLKPANIMLGKFGETLVVDWGLAKVMGKVEAEGRAGDVQSEEGPLLASSSSIVEPTRMETAHGTPQYMSPEQAVGRIDQLGPACDVYGLGATLYYILTGRAPFPDGVTRQILKGDFPRPGEVDAEVPRALEAVCLRAMQLLPVDRYPSAVALADDVERWLGDQWVSAYHDPFAARAARWVRRHRPLVAGLAALLVTGSVALAVSNVLVRREATKAEDARDQAEANLKLATGAIDAMLLRVSEEKLIFQPGLIELRAKLVEEATKLYQDLIGRRPDDPAIRRDAALIYRKEANNLRLIGQFARSLEFSGRAIAAYEAILGANPGHPADSDSLGHALVDHGDGLWMIGRADEATEAYRRVIRMIGPIRAAHPDDRTLPLPLARAQFGLGEALLEAGDLPGAGRSYEESIRLFTSYLDVKGMGFLGRLLRVPALCGRGLVARLEGRGPDAERAFNQALEDLETNDDASKSGKNPDVEYFRALVLNALGEGLAPDPPRRQAARNAFDEAASIARKLCSKFSSTVEYRLEHATALIGRASVSLETGEVPRPEIAADLQAAQEALETLLKELPGMPRARARLAGLMTLGGKLALDRDDPVEARFRFTRASEEWKRALDAQPGNLAYRAHLEESRDALRGLDAP